MYEMNENFFFLIPHSQNEITRFTLKKVQACHFKRLANNFEFSLINVQYVTLGSNFEIYIQSHPRNVVKKIMNKVFLQIQLTDPGQRRQHFTSGSDSTGKCEYHAVTFSRKFAWPRAMIIRDDTPILGPILTYISLML